MPSQPEIDLTGDDLRLVIEAARTVAEASADPQFDRVVVALLEACTRVSEGDRAALYLHDEVNDQLLLVATIPSDDFLAEAYRMLPVTTRTGQHMFDLHAAAYALSDLGNGTTRPSQQLGIRHVAMIPVHLQKRPKGVLHVARSEDRPFDARSIRLAQLVVELSSVYLENARLFADAQRRLRETALLLEIARVSASSTELVRGLEGSIAILTQMIDASSAFVMVLDEGDAVLRGVATTRADFRDDVAHLRISMTEPSLSVRAVKTQMPIAVVDALSDGDVHKVNVERFSERSLLAIPLVVRDRSIGVIVVDDTRGPRRWTSSEIERAELVARQIAASVANAQLYEELRKSYTELARAQEELVKRERLAAIGQLSATLAHEVRNPLGVIFNSLATIQKLVPMEGDAQTLLAIMREEAQRLDRLVRDLLDFARPRKPAFETESLRAVVEGAVSAARRALGEDVVDVDIDIPDDLPPVRIDASMMRRAVVNLVVNAAQATEAHGCDARGPIVVRACAERRAGRRYARLDVLDHGEGIPSSIASRVFEPFFTTKATGTGLGLAVVKGIVESHQGTFELASAPGEGTRATLLVPVD